MIPQPKEFRCCSLGTTFLRLRFLDQSQFDQGRMEFRGTKRTRVVKNQSFIHPKTQHVRYASLGSDIPRPRAWLVGQIGINNDTDKSIKAYLFADTYATTSNYGEVPKRGSTTRKRHNIKVFGMKLYV